MKSKLEKFLILFTRLRKETNNSPENLKWLPTEKPYLIGLCYDLDSCCEEILHFLSKKNTKHTVVPDIFSRNWDEYVANWKEVVSEAADPEKERVNSELLVLFRQAEEKAIAEGKEREEFWTEFLNKFPREMGWTLDPLAEDPSAIMDDIKLTLYNIVDNDLMEDVFDDKSMGAWFFFEKTIGIDYSAIYARWRSAPELFIPARTLHRDITPIVELYNEAVRAYVFGLTVASVAMCRALLEHVLRKHYHVQGKDLENIISIAEAKHEHLKGLALQDRRRLANTVLHKYESRAENLDQAVVNFLLTLRHVVTNIPPRSRQD